MSGLNAIHWLVFNLKTYYMDFVFPSKPLRYELELTNSCMNHCDVCGNSLIRTKGAYMVDWKKVIDKISYSSYKSKYACSIRLTGGEPTLHPDFFEIIDYIESKGIAHGLFSTGCWDHLDTNMLLKKYSESTHFSHFLISLHGADKYIHSKFTNRVASFDETCKYIKLMSSYGLTVITNTVLTKYSYNQIKDIVELSQSLGANASLFERLFTKDGNLEPTESELNNALQEIDTLREEGKNCISSMCLPKCFSPFVKDYTKSGFEICTISTLGEVRPSNLTPFSFGNILNDEIEIIWNSQQAINYRGKLHSKCINCTEVYKCRGGLKFQTSNDSIDFDKFIKQPYLEKRTIKYKLGRQLITLPIFEIIHDKNGIFLVSYSSSLRINPYTLKIVELIQNNKTIGEIFDMFGEPSLKLIGYLHQYQYINLLENNYVTSQNINNAQHWLGESGAEVLY